MNPGLCICGRSPTKYCCGWHGLTEEEYQEKKKEYDENNKEFLTEDISHDTWRRRSFIIIQQQDV